VSAARDEQAAVRKTAEAELRKAREAIDALRAELASAMKTLDQAAAERLASEEAAAAAHSQSQAAEAKLSAVSELLAKSAAKVRTLEQAQQEGERRVRALESKLQAGGNAAAAKPAPSVVLEELLAGFQALSGAETINEVLTTLVEQMAAQFPRVALFRVRKGHLHGEHQIGFDLKTDINKLVLPLGMDSLPARAASSGQIERLSGNELKEYAASLLHEMEQMYEADVAAGINGPDLQKRLSGNLDFARSIYGSRTALEGTDAASLIEDELAGLIDARRGTPFAQDLATAAGHARESAAEAS
jgi:multidrug efflux pump subunit AcrA (membrane-fusion protein)